MQHCSKNDDNVEQSQTDYVTAVRCISDEVKRCVLQAIIQFAVMNQNYRDIASVYHVFGAADPRTKLREQFFVCGIQITAICSVVHAAIPDDIFLLLVCMEDAADWLIKTVPVIAGFYRRNANQFFDLYSWPPSDAHFPYRNGAFNIPVPFAMGQF